MNFYLMKNSSFKLIKRILLLAKPFLPAIIGLFFLTLLGTPIALMKPLAMKILIDSAFGSHPVPGFISVFFPANFQFTFTAVVIIAAAFFISVALIDNINNVITWVLETITGERLVLNFKTTLFDHIQRLSLAYHDRQGTSDALYRLQSDTSSIRSFLMGSLSSIISSFITLISMITVMFFINWHFAVISLCVMPPLFILIRLSTRRFKEGWKKVKEDESRAMAVVHEVLSSLRVVKAFGQEDYEGKRFVNQSNLAIKGQLKMAWTGAIFYFLVGMLFATGTAIFIYLGAKYVHQGVMTLGELTLVIAYLGQIYGPLQSISKNLNSIQSSITSMDRVFTLLDHEKEVKEDPHAIHLARAKGSFEFQDVSFAYENGTEILHNISFNIHPGDRVGIMGSTGAGKSTLISLLTRFYDATVGTITIDEVDIKKYRLADFRSQFGIVLQDPVLFSTSIGENIRYGKPGASEKEMIDAAKAANAHEFIMRCKDGYDTLVGERGMQLSGGERQRISLARAFIKNAPVLILDEPTSSLDIRTEAQIMEAMERLMQGRTTFMITHRLDTLSSCNIILHLEGGRLIDIVNNKDPLFIKEKKLSLLSNIS